MFVYRRIIRFADTDAAGVVYFASLLAICHEAYEEMLRQAGIKLDYFFGNENLAIPIIHAEIDFFKPLFVGDLITIKTRFNRVSEKVFEIKYFVEKETEEVAVALTRHIGIQPQTRETVKIPDFILEIGNKINGNC
ncbi:MAG: acyl-CoA thioesterase [Geminocystis sp.]|nr:acyl-CoA thioesterase [Geminocystis sp.]MCS7146887.1 acyl-CoA thioesterase [Geminocystis sp.]MCX8078907.1 acyl-CoA thioesterase [Geminocystis sp.]MDW8463255.1 thioesterase family protein [Geminocystis sp.]HIK36797.1 acyl-CoA thioesterase [Geminocystis sp. M7585_C2015_104]